jgi:nucleoside-diphosphate-sugar epimerase
MSMIPHHLFCFGLGYTASTLAASLPKENWVISGTCRTEEKCAQLKKQGYNAYHFNQIPPELFQTVTHILLSIPPSAEGDSVLLHYGKKLAALPHLQWVGYLSTTGVYGDHAGGWVDETTPVNPPNDRSHYRVEAENAWLASGLPVHIFRLSGIYGPGSSALDNVRNGTARRIDKQGQYFSRIHVEDIARVLAASIAQPSPGEIYNLADDLPCAQEEVVAYAASLLGVELPPLVSFDQAQLSEMARSFYGSSRRVRNDKIKKQFQLDLKYPTYREGLQAIITQGN